METLNRVIQVPSWAYDACWYYFAVAAVVAVYGLFAIVQLFMVPGAIRRLIPTTTMALAIALSVGVSTVLALMQFWICRSALAPVAAAATKEKFEVKCSSDADCTAVMGTPQGPLCSCGGRGFCGGCVMQNDMEPQASFAAEFAPIEPFAVRTQPPRRPTPAARR